MEHKVEYNGETMSYNLIKSKIKNIYIYVKNGKVTVKAPSSLKDKSVHDFIKKKSKWIYEKVKQDRENTKTQEGTQEEIKLEDVEQLKKIVENTIQKYSKLLKQVPNKVRIRDIKYAWGSCSSNRNITINKKLAKKDEKIIEYVVLHEMCHLKQMNHSKEFWALLETYMPEYRVYKRMLK